MYCSYLLFGVDLSSEEGAYPGELPSASFDILVVVTEYGLVARSFGGLMLSAYLTQ